LSPTTGSPTSTPASSKNAAAPRDAIATLGREDVRWHDLYHVFEIVRAEVGDEICAQGWATKADVNRFKHTANDRGTIGREARHGHRRWNPPANPMTFDEARNLIHGIVRSWLRSKAGPT
jgi:hypothetical protein